MSTIVNTSSTGNQYQGTAAGLANGNVIVTWFDDNLHTIHAQFYDALGNPIGSEFAPDLNILDHTDTNLNNFLPRVVANSTGGFDLAFTSVYQGPTGLISCPGFTTYDANGVRTDGSAGIPFNSTIDRYNVVKPFAGSFVEVFQETSGLLGYDNDIFIIDGNNATHSIVQANVQTTGLQTWPDLAVLADQTHYVVSWWDDQTKFVKFRLFDSSDNPLTGEIIVQSVGTAVGTSDLGYRGQAVAALAGASDDFVVVWNSVGTNVDDTSGYGIRAAIYTSSGLLVKNFAVNLTTFGDEETPSVVGLLDGGFAVAWRDTFFNGTVVRTFDALGNPGVAPDSVTISLSNAIAGGPSESGGACAPSTRGR
jgi:hypothetical protein